MLPSAKSATLRSLDRALDLLHAFREKDEFGVSELGRRLGMPKSAVHRITKTLVLRGFLEQTPQRRYRLGVSILELGNLRRLQIDLVRDAEPVLRELSRRAGANVHLAKLDHGEVFDLLRIEHPTPLRITRAPMLRRPAHCTALGKALLAFSSGRVVEEILRQGLSRLTRRTITQPQRLLAELERVRERGYALDNEEFYGGLRCVAAPVFTESAEAVAAVSVSALITHLTEDRVPQFALWVMDAARHVSEHLGYRPTAGTA